MFGVQRRILRTPNIELRTRERSIPVEMITLRAPDISCEHCVATVKKTVGQFPGVQSVEADAETKIISLTFDPMQADLSKIEEALEEEGYPVEK
jgi:copper chaperone